MRDGAKEEWERGRERVAGSERERGEGDEQREREGGGEKAGDMETARGRALVFGKWKSFTI